MKSRKHLSLVRALDLKLKAQNAVKMFLYERGREREAKRFKL